jgi:hypothetical protein
MIKDIRLTPQFYQDYDKAPSRVKEALDKLVRMILDTGQFPRSMQVHMARSAYNDLYIGYVTRSRQHWRILFETDESLMVGVRLLDHDKADQYLRKV